MTICKAMKDAVDLRLAERKPIYQIGKELCSGIKFANRKVIKIIKDERGQDYLDENADWLMYKGTPQATSAKIKRLQKFAVPPPTKSDLIELKKCEEKINDLNIELGHVFSGAEALFQNDWVRLCLKNPGDRMKKVRFHLNKALNEIGSLWSETSWMTDILEVDEKYKKEDEEK